jgi:ABC-type Na+ efflux pump permease subunit
MLRTIFGIGLLALIGLFLLKVFFGLFGFLFALLWVLLAWAIRIAIVGGIIYLILRIFLPDTAKKIEEQFRK